MPPRPKADPVPTKEKLIGVRHIQCILSFFCLSLAYALRVNLSVGLVAMTDKDDFNETEILGNKPRFLGIDINYYDFTETQKSLMLSSFFWGYIFTQVPGGYIAQRYGAKMILLVGLIICSILTILTPFVIALGGWQGLCAVRALEGLTQGAVHPATHTLLAKWSPAKDRGMLATICYSGAQFGTILMLGTSGIIAESFMRWPGIFYISGICGFLWAVFWFFFAASTPDKNRYISPEELKYIEDSRSAGKVHAGTELAPTPWFDIFISMPFLSLLVVHCTHMWGYWTLLTQIPSYLKNIFGVDMKSSALLSSLPYAVMLVLSFFFVWISKLLQKKDSLSLSFNRKLFNSIGHWIPMISLIALGYVPSNHSNVAVALLTITVGISAATYLGFQVNHIDLSPNYAGTLMGITNAAANIASGIAPLASGAIVQDPKNINEWRLVFFLAAFFYFIGNLMFVVFGKTDVQWWDSPNDLSISIYIEQEVPLTTKKEQERNNA
ncbi:putative inorganic phosphate cotransporter isoform X2 [Scaptodrosophila lebanonensis]|uniref:Putative inorganic phosphate cotransporter n=1 Tax=Drosophila lebanonensis TaxID=7225 RepID=A0A6J2U1D9_DROLE|nr:putative inorganic phosphate cotransporter isoform X2 [Scaptodrosophila lebanonensis]